MIVEEDYDILLNAAAEDTIRGIGGSDWVDVSDMAGFAEYLDGLLVVRPIAGASPTLSLEVTDTLGLVTGAGSDTIRPGEEFEVVQTNDGRDYIEASNRTTDLIAQGGKGSDTIIGGHGDDVLRGGKGFDSLFGGAGDDTLYGGFGDDMMIGGTGADVFVFSPRDLSAFPEALNKITIMDFEVGIDRLVIEGAVEEHLPRMLDYAVITRGSTVILSDAITLVGMVGIREVDIFGEV